MLLRGPEVELALVFPGGLRAIDIISCAAFGRLKVGDYNRAALVFPGGLRVRPAIRYYHLREGPEGPGRILCQSMRARGIHIRVQGNMRVQGIYMTVSI